MTAGGVHRARFVVYQPRFLYDLLQVGVSEGVSVPQV